VEVDVEVDPEVVHRLLDLAEHELDSAGTERLGGVGLRQRARVGLAGRERVRDSLAQVRVVGREAADAALSAAVCRSAALASASSAKNARCRRRARSASSGSSASPASRRTVSSGYEEDAGAVVADERAGRLEGEARLPPSNPAR
jgi:hypothetical protein